MNAGELMEKANRVVASAKLLLDAGDVDGACNRAYYAMFDAARAALIQWGKPPAYRGTHKGLTYAAVEKNKVSYSARYCMGCSAFPLSKGGRGDLWQSCEGQALQNPPPSPFCKGGRQSCSRLGQLMVLGRL
jgi:hypothetical protein